MRCIMKVRIFEEYAVILYQSTLLVFIIVF